MGEAGNRRLKLKFTNDSLTFTTAIHGKNNNLDLESYWPINASAILRSNSFNASI